MYVAARFNSMPDRPALWFLFMLLIGISALVGVPAHAGLQEGIQAYDNKDYRTALKEFLPLATKGSPEAQHYLGSMYGFGEGVPEDDKKSVEWYTRSAQQDNVDSQGMLGAIFLNGSKATSQDYEQAVFWLTKAAEKGDADSQYNLGIMYHDALGVQQDFTKAAFWYSKAAEHGFEMAMFDTGVAHALLNLGVMYRKGEGVKQDLVKADMLYLLAELTGNKMAATNRKNLEPEMTSEQVKEAHALAKEWTRNSTSLK